MELSMSAALNAERVNDLFFFIKLYLFQGVGFDLQVKGGLFFTIVSSGIGC
jgi:hypothetical protein